MSGEGPASSAARGSATTESVEPAVERAVEPVAESAVPPGAVKTGPVAPSAVVAVDDLTPEQFGVQGVDASRPLRPYFPRESDGALREALTSGARVVLVSAEPTSGAIRSTYEMLRETYAGREVVLLDRLNPQGQGPELVDRLLASGADVVWAGGLRRVLDERPFLSTGSGWVATRSLPPSWRCSHRARSDWSTRWAPATSGPSPTGHV